MLMEQPEGFSKVNNLNVDNCFNALIIYEGGIV